MSYLASSPGPFSLASDHTQILDVNGALVTDTATSPPSGNTDVPLDGDTNLLVSSASLLTCLTEVYTQVYAARYISEEPALHIGGLDQLISVMNAMFTQTGLPLPTQFPPTP